MGRERGVDERRDGWGGEKQSEGCAGELRGGWEGRGVKFPSGFQLGQINSVLELTLTPSLPPSPRPSTQAKLLSLAAGDGEGERLHYGLPFSDQSGRKWHNKSESGQKERGKLTSRGRQKQ